MKELIKKYKEELKEKNKMIMKYQRDLSLDGDELIRLETEAEMIERFLISLDIFPKIPKMRKTTNLQMLKFFGEDEPCDIANYITDWLSTIYKSDNPYTCINNLIDNIEEV